MTHVHHGRADTLSEWLDRLHKENPSGYWFLILVTAVAGAVVSVAFFALLGGLLTQTAH